MLYPDTVQLKSDNLKIHTQPGLYKIEYIKERIVYRGATQQDTLNLIMHFKAIELKKEIELQEF